MSSATPTSSGLASAHPAAPAGRRGSGIGLDWAVALELTIATNCTEPYKSRVKELFP